MSSVGRNPGNAHPTQIVVVVAACSGILAAATDLRPTGSVPVDALLVAIAAGTVSWAAATAPWWLAAGVALLASGTAASVPWAVVGLAAVALASLVGADSRDLSWALSLVVLLAIQVLARCEVGWFFGWSTLFSCAALAVLFAWGASGRPPAVRRRVWQVAGGSATFATIATLGFAIAALNARGPLLEGDRQARAGLAALQRGDMAAAEAAFTASLQPFREAENALDAPWAQGARLLPVVAQHRASMSNLAIAAAEAATVAGAVSARIDTDSLRMMDGRIDIAAVRRLESPFQDLAVTIDRLQQAVTRSRSSWLAGPVQGGLAALDAELATNRVSAENALVAVNVAPRLLGDSGVRHYFVAFTTPSEARGLGGFMGNWAELTVTDGRVKMTEFGRLADLAEATGGRRRVITGLGEFVGHWGGFGFASEAGGATDDEVWSIATMAPDFPTVAQVISQLYPQSGGQPIDGVFMLDSRAIAALLSFTGPIGIEGIAEPLTAANAAEFIEKDQYLVPGYDQRIDLLEQVARTAVDRLLSTTLPPPAEVAEELAPLASEGRLMAWSANAEEQDLLARVNLDGAFPPLGDAEGVAVTVDNGGGNKIDAYLRMAVDYEVIDPGSSGDRTTAATVTLTNTAPSAGLPDYVIGNAVGLPEGTNRTWLSVYTALPMVGVEIDGEPDGMQTSDVFGWHVATRFVDVPPQGTVTLRLTLQGPLANPTALPFVRRVQALASLPTYRVKSERPG